jgi:hypothetical protein
MQTAKGKRSSLLPLLGFVGASGLFLWWAAKSPNQQAAKTLPPSATKWRARYNAITVAPVFVRGMEVLPKGAQVYAVPLGNDELSIAAIGEREAASPDDLDWFAVRVSDVRRVS